MTGVSTPPGPAGAGRARVLLDGATAPMVPAARDVLMAALDAGWADPRRLYAEGRQARRLLDDAREAVASGLGVRPPEVSFLPSGPVALTAGVEGIRYAGRRRGMRTVAGAVEHSAVLVPGRAVAAGSDTPQLLDEVGGGLVRAGAVARVGGRARGARHGGRRAPERER